MRVYATLQFSFRLESYLLMAFSGMLLAALVLTGGAERRMLRWRLLLVPVAAVCVLGAVEQVDAHTPGGTRATVLASFDSPANDQEGMLDYVDDELPIVRTALPQVVFPPSTTRGDRAVQVSDPGGRRLLDSNIRSAPAFVHVEGARITPRPTRRPTTSWNSTRTRARGGPPRATPPRGGPCASPSAPPTACPWRPGVCSRSPRCWSSPSSSR